METKTFSKGEVIFREGEESSEAYRLLTGEVEISIGTSAGARALARLTPGVFFGEMSLIDDKPRSATATALAECKVEVFHEDNFTVRVLGDIGNLYPYLSTLFDRIRSTDAMLQWHLNKAAQPGQPKPSVEAALRQTAAVSIPAGPAATAGRIHITSASKRGRHVDLEVSKLPFRIGRATDGHGPSPLAPNDLSIHDQKPYHVSRNHCIIERSGENFLVRDFGSKVGTIVNGMHLGTAFDAFVAPLNPGENTLILGSEESPHRFQVVVR